MAARLEALFRQYRRKLTSGSLTSYSDQIESLISVAKKLENTLTVVGTQSDDDDDDEDDENTRRLKERKRNVTKTRNSEIAAELRQVWDDILDAFSRRLSDELEIRELARDTYDQWLDIKRLRGLSYFIVSLP